MAVTDIYVNTAVYDANGAPLKRNAMIAGGTHLRVAIETCEIATTDDVGSVKRLFKGLDGNIVPVAILAGCDALTACVIDFGCYDTDLGAALSAAYFATGVSLAAATKLSPGAGLNLMAAVDVANFKKKLYEHMGHNDINKHDQGYDLAAKITTAATAPGTLTVMLIYAQG